MLASAFDWARERRSRVSERRVSEPMFELWVVDGSKTPRAELWLNITRTVKDKSIRRSTNKCLTRLRCKGLRGVTISNHQYSKRSLIRTRKKQLLQSRRRLLGLSLLPDVIEQIKDWTCRSVTLSLFEGLALAKSENSLRALLLSVIVNSVLTNVYCIALLGGHPRHPILKVAVPRWWWCNGEHQKNGENTQHSNQLTWRTCAALSEGKRRRCPTCSCAQIGT